MQYFKFENWRIGGLKNSISDVTNSLNIFSVLGTFLRQVKIHTPPSFFCIQIMYIAHFSLLLQLVLES